MTAHRSSWFRVTVRLAAAGALLAAAPAARALSPLYHYTVVAADGMRTSDGFVLAGIEPEVSVNEEGRVAFTARIGGGDQLLVGRNPADLRNISRAPDGRNFGFPQINDEDRIVSRELHAGLGIIRVWDAHNPAAFEVVASTTLSPFWQLTHPTLGNGRAPGGPWGVGYLGKLRDADAFSYYANSTGRPNEFEAVSALTGTTLSRFRAMSARGAALTFVAQFTDAETGISRITVFCDDFGWISVPIASTAGGEWKELCHAPGISDNGQMVAFIGDHWEDGPGLYLVQANPTFSRGISVGRLFGLNKLIAYDENARPITFRVFNMVDRVAILHQEFPPAGLDGDSLLIAFKATPARAGRPNPAPGSGDPFLFSDREGVWVVRVDIEAELAPWSDGAPILHDTAPVPVVQAGDVIAGSVVEDSALYDPLSDPFVDLDGQPYGHGRGDHFVAFSVQTAAGVRVIRAARIDHDRDGLMDHWETSGVDVDGDGEAELDLPAMGADPHHQDIFVEVDWTADRTRGGYRPWTNRFPPYTAQGMAAMFRRAPVPNPDGTNGITLHVDAGRGGWYAEDPESSSSMFGYMSRIPYSVNMPDDSRLLGGGDVVGPAGDPTTHLDMVYFGVPLADPVPGVRMRALHEVKNEHFGNKDKWAREFAFKYALLTDCQLFIEDAAGRPFLFGVAGATSNTVTSVAALPAGLRGPQAVLITGGKGVGQVRRMLAAVGNTITLLDPWETIPNTSSTFTLMRSSVTGMGEVYFYPDPDFNSVGGNDFIIGMSCRGVNDGGWLADYGAFWRTMNHELGHCIGLRHGGTDHDNDKPAYVSIMNYKYLREGYTNFAGRTDRVFDDWANLKHEPAINGESFGNSYNEIHGGNPPDDPEMAVDLRKPVVAVIAPAGGTVFATGAVVNVAISATDDVAVERVFALFDLDGDGAIEDPAERLAAAPAGGNVYATAFAGVEGPLTTRGVMGLAFDTAGNVGAAVVAVVAGDPAGAGRLIYATRGTFAAEGAGGTRREAATAPIAVPGTGRLTFTVTGTPPVRSGAGASRAVTAGTPSAPGDASTSRYDSAVSRLVMGGTEHALTPVCSPAGLDPSVCSSYWQSPSGGTTVAYLQGPAIYAGGVFQGHPEQQYALQVTFEPVDLTPPRLRFTAPATGAFVEVSAALDAAVFAADDYTVTAVRVAFDVNGDGDEADPGESVAAAPAGAGAYRAAFPNVSGAAGPRALRAVAADGAGHETRAVAGVEVRVPDVSPPFVFIKSPPPGWPLKTGDSLRLEIQAADDVELAALTAAFDLNGDGDSADAGETLAPGWTAANLYTAAFYNVTGSNGSRTVSVTAADPSLNLGRAELPVAVGGVAPVTQSLFTASGTIPAQPSQWSGGRQQVVEFDPLAVPGSGALTFIVTGDPSVRQFGVNITRSDAFVRNVTYGGVAKNLAGSLTCNLWTSPVSVCTTKLDVAAAGELDFSILGPGQWNTWGEFVGHPAQNYELRMLFTSVDITPPTIAFASPTLGQNVALGTGLTVRVAVTDDVAVASVVLSMDVNGDLDTDDFQESLAAVPRGGGVYQAQFGALTGGPAARTIAAHAMDTSFNMTDRSVSVGVGGVGAGEATLFSREATMPAQPDGYSGGSRQVVPYGPITVPGQGRITLRVTSTPSIRRLGTNLQRADPMVVKISFNGQTNTLTPVCNAWDRDPAVCVSTWDSPGPGTLSLEVLGGGTWNIWGEFVGHYAQDYALEVLFMPGPRVTAVAPAVGWVGGHELVTVNGGGFAYDAVVLFGEVPASEVVRVSDTQLTCRLPPGVAGPAEVRVLNPDLQHEPWNYGEPYGLFGTLSNGLTYHTAAPTNPAPERLLGTWKGGFRAVGQDEPQQEAPFPFPIPGAGRLRFEAYAFVPILSPIPGPYTDRDNLAWCNESTAVRSFRSEAGDRYYPEVESSDLDYPYGPVISTSIRIVPEGAAGTAQMTLKGPARWNAFWRDFGEYDMEGAPSQTWSVAAWFADQPVLTSVAPPWGGNLGGTRVTLRGAHFAPGIQVRFGGRPATGVTIVSNTALSCTTPPGAAGAASVEVELLGMTARLASAFTYEPVVITQFTHDRGGPPVSVDLRTEEGKSYRLQRNLDLRDRAGWTDVGAAVNGSGAGMRFSDPAPPAGANRVFYRLIIAPR